MIINRLKYLAVCLLVLLNVVSTMGGSNDDYKYYNSQANSSLCLSFKNNKLTDCCKEDDMQRIYVHKTGPFTGIFHIKHFKKVLCYDKNKRKFKLHRRKFLGLQRCRHQRRREREHRHRGEPYTGCTLNPDDIHKLRRRGCELYEELDYNGFLYISFKRKSMYLGVRRGRVQKHGKRLRGSGDKVREPRVKDTRFLLRSESTLINRNLCQA